MTCEEARPLIDAYLDRELDLSTALGMERHLETCRECSDVYRQGELLHAEIESADLNFASEEMLTRVRASVERQAGLRPVARPAWRYASYVGAAAAIVVVASFLTMRFASPAKSIDDEIVDIHLSSLIGNHLIDVPSSDRHTVKPWFQGRIDFSPPVPDLTEAGFVLAGGRVDVLDGRKAAALIYKRRDHVINLWIAPGNGPDDGMREVHGYRVLSWSGNGMNYHAVSDVDPEEFKAFRQAFETQANAGATVH